MRHFADAHNAERRPVYAIDFTVDLVLVSRDVDAIDAVGRVNHAFALETIAVPSPRLHHASVHRKAVTMALIERIEGSVVVIAVDR